MSKEVAWYHCGRCGNIFKENETAICPKCSQSPVISKAEMSYARMRDEKKRKRKNIDPSTSSSQEKKTVYGKQANKNTVVWFVGIWMLFLGLLVGGVSWFRRANVDEEAKHTIGYSLMASEDHKQKVRKTLRECNLVLRGYYSSISPEVRASYTLRPEKTLERMMLTGGSLTTMAKNENLRPYGVGIFETKNGEGMGTLWKTSDNEILEAVFREDKNQEWKLDWEQMTRYSSLPWAIFLGGAGPDEGEFRLLARQRTSSGSPDRGDLRVVFMNPMTVGDMQSGLRSPEVTVKGDSLDGILLRAAFRAFSNRPGAFGLTMTRRDPRGVIRVRVKLKRLEKNSSGQYPLELEQLVALHWLEDDDPGLTLEQANMVLEKTSATKDEKDEKDEHSEEQNDEESEEEAEEDSQ